MKQKVEEQVEKQKISQSAETNKRNTPFTKEALKLAWDEYAQSAEIKASPVLSTIVQGCEYELQSNFHIIIFLSNAIQETQFQRLQPRLHKALRDALENDLIVVSAETKEMSHEEQKKKLYTDDDKLNFLMEEYPAFATLKERLGLALI